MTLIIEWLPCDQCDQQSITINSRLTKLITSWLYLHTQLTHLRSNSWQNRVLKRWANLFTTNCAHDIRVSVDTDFWDADVAVRVERHKLCRATADSGHVFSRRSHTPPLPPSLPPLWLPSHNRKPISKTGVLKYGLFPHALWCMGKRKSWLACDGPTIILCLI